MRTKRFASLNTSISLKIAAHRWRQYINITNAHLTGSICSWYFVHWWFCFPALVCLCFCIQL